MFLHCHFLHSIKIKYLGLSIDTGNNILIRMFIRIPSVVVLFPFKNDSLEIADICWINLL